MTEEEQRNRTIMILLPVGWAAVPAGQTQETGMGNTSHRKAIHHITTICCRFNKRPLHSGGGKIRTSKGLDGSWFLSIFLHYNWMKSRLKFCRNNNFYVSFKVFYTPWEMFHNLCTDFLIISEFSHIDYFPNLTRRIQRLYQESCFKSTTPVCLGFSINVIFCFYCIWRDVSLWSKVVAPTQQ